MSYKSSRVSRMMDEDDQGLDLRRIETLVKDSPTQISPKVKLRFDGRIYRSIHDSSPSRKRSRKPKASELLGMPDESIVDEAYSTVSTSLLTVPPTSKELSDASDLEIEAPSKPTTQEVPDSCLKLLALHIALEQAIVLHLSVDGKAAQVASAIARAANAAINSSESTYKVSLQDLTSYHQVRATVERASGHSFGERELAQLLWLWNAGPPEAIGLTVNKTVERCKSTNSKITTYGFGLDLVLQRNTEAHKPTLAIVGLQKKQTSAPSAVTARDGMSFIALWSQDSEARRTEMRARIDNLLQRQTTSNANVTPTKTRLTQGMLPTPPPTKRRRKEASPDIQFDISVPLAKLPSLRSDSGVDITIADYGQSSSPSTSRVPAGSTKDRAMSLLERIKAKEQALLDGQAGGDTRIAQLGRLSPTRKSLKANAVAVEREKARMAAYKRRSMLSRLPDVADALFMLFAPKVTPPSPSASIPTPPTKHRRAIPLEEVCTIISKSSKVALSAGEASSAVELLCEVCSRFVKLDKIDHRTWLAMVGQPGDRMDLQGCKDIIRRELVIGT